MLGQGLNRIVDGFVVRCNAQAGTRDDAPIIKPLTSYLRVVQRDDSYETRADLEKRTAHVLVASAGGGTASSLLTGK